MSGAGLVRKRRYTTPNFVVGRGGQRPRGIVLHTTVGSWDATRSWFADPGAGVSAHYLVGLDGRVAQFVDEEDTARHAGRVKDPTVGLAAEGGGSDGVNPITVGIEFEDGGEPFDARRGAAQYEIGARLIAEIAGRWRIPLDREHVIGHREVFAKKGCPGDLDVGRLLERARELATGGTQPLLACLLPARNAEADIAGWLDSVAALDALAIALDDGSTDRTAELLKASPLLATLLTNEPREGYQGWDDRANRARLLTAADELGADWVLFLDADERIDADDALALREFLRGDAVGGLAYGLRLYRTWEELVLPRPTVVYRLFDPRPDDELPEARLHFNPLPTRIPPGARVETTIRARHLDSPERLRRRRRKYEEANPGSTDTGATAALMAVPEGELVSWPARPIGLPPLATERASELPTAPGGDGPLLACLLPIRNGAGELPGYLACAESLGARVIALDDGSTDSSAAILRDSPIVDRVLANPVRETYAGWDDAANRQALLEAAVEAGVRWALFLDADERIAADDAAALRAFLDAGADPSSAYGFRVYRMLGEGGHYDRAGLWVYRLFAPRAGQTLPERALHLVPLPTSIPPERRRRTTVRIQHFGGSDEARRRARLRKYEEADPERHWQSDYAGPILQTGEPRPWRPRPEGLGVLADPTGAGLALDLEEIAADAPVLSAIVIATDDEETIEESVRAVVEQRTSEPFEVIVVVSGSPGTARVVREAFGARVELVELEERVLPGRARNEGLRRARGEFVSFPGSHVRISPGSLAHRSRAHENGWAMVTGSIVNGNRSRAGWASYFLDHSSALPGRPSGPLAGAPAHCSYVREFVLEAGGFPAHIRAGEDTVLNGELWRRGHRAWREQAIELVHRSPCGDLRSLVHHHFIRGRAWGRILRGDFGTGAKRPGRALRGYRRSRLASTDERVADWGGSLSGEYRRARLWVRAGIWAAWAGARWELACGREGRADASVSSR